jgi:hypothetical protein
MELEMIQNFKSSIFLYNKQDELITYAELDSNGSLANYYNINDNILTKLNINRYKEKNKLYTDIVKTKTEFDGDCMLFHMFFDKDDSYCKVVKKGSKRIEYPNVISTVHSYNNDFIESFTINPSFLQDWAKKM